MTKNTEIEDIYQKADQAVDQEEFNFLKQFLTTTDLSQFLNFRQLEKVLRQQYCVKGRNPLRKSKVLYVYDSLVADGTLSPSGFRQIVIKKPMKSQSGVLVITVLTSPYPVVNGRPQRFSCQWNCYYCPNEPGQPRSYLHDEPSVLRANQNNFDPILQFTERAMTLYVNGHPLDKVELLVLGGTWSSYPMSYREDFVRDLFFAANTLLVRSNRREPLSLTQEKTINSQAKCRIIGITLETRPDCINPEELRHFRRVGCTRVQLGIQHTDDAILDRVNRQCSTLTTKGAIRQLLNVGFKVDGHFMPQLPGATREIDQKMFGEVLYDSELQIDQWKIYPCETTPWTVIKKWADEGKYVPYSDGELVELLIWVKQRVHPWIRLNRVVRDIPTQYILGGLDNGNLREEILARMRRENLVCRCIRCREVKDGRQSDRPNRKQIGSGDISQRPNHTMELVIRHYLASGGDEYFLSMESPDRITIYGFLRLRLPGKGVKNIFPRLQDHALIRELHVYGQLVSGGQVEGASQHTGIGKRLLTKAETLAFRQGYRGISVIAGVGTRNYYEKRGYCLLGEMDGEMMRKDLGWLGYGCQMEVGQFHFNLTYLVSLVIGVGLWLGSVWLRDNNKYIPIT